MPGSTARKRRQSKAVMACPPGEATGLDLTYFFVGSSRGHSSTFCTSKCAIHEEISFVKTRRSLARNYIKT